VAKGAELGTEETSSVKNQKTKRERRRTSQVASSGRRYFTVTVSVIVNELSNKQLHRSPEPINFLSLNPGHVTIYFGHGNLKTKA
jgi:hypothetical protein